MAKLLRFLLLLIIAAFIVREGESLKCWTCNSYHAGFGFGGGQGCADPFIGSTDIKGDLDFAIDCNSKTRKQLKLLPDGLYDWIPLNLTINDSELVYVCSKLTATVLGAPVVSRGCAVGLPDVTTKSCMYLTAQRETGVNVLTCDACSEDYCNGAAGFEEFAVLLVISLFLLLV